MQFLIVLILGYIGKRFNDDQTSKQEHREIKQREIKETNEKKI